MRENSIAVLPTAALLHRNADTEYRFRPDSDFYYLTGFDEPNALLVLVPGREEGEQVLFVQPRDPGRETWTGRRLGVERAPERLEVNEAHSIDTLGQILPELMRGRSPLYYRTGSRPELDSDVLNWIHGLRSVRQACPGPSEILDPATLVHEMRLHTDASELRWMRQAAEITRLAHQVAFQSTRPGCYEYEIEARIEMVFRRHGGSGAAYPSIVASGANATILHYTRNDRRMGNGDLLLIDAGCEYGCYAADVTRTFPVGRRFSATQRLVYDLVLAAQAAAMEAVRPGCPFSDYHERALEVLVDGLRDLGLLTGSRDEILESGTYRRFYMHRTGHWLGLDVHDAGNYFTQGTTHRPLEPGMVVTVEPGLYIAEDDETVPAEFRGVGVRIEDNLLVTESGHEVLTAEIPRTAEEIEELRASALSAPESTHEKR